MATVTFFSFSETDRQTVLLIRGRTVNPNYTTLNFRVQDLLQRWDTTDPAVIKQAISKSICLRKLVRMAALLERPQHNLPFDPGAAQLSDSRCSW